MLKFEHRYFLQVKRIYAANTLNMVTNRKFLILRPEVFPVINFIEGPIAVNYIHIKDLNYWKATEADRVQSGSKIKFLWLIAWSLQNVYS